jgi:hypothetical protein
VEIVRDGKRKVARIQTCPLCGAKTEWCCQDEPSYGYKRIEGY